MPSLERKGNGRRVADSDDDAGAASDGEPIAQSDQLLAKVEPEYLNRPIDLRQGDAYLRKLIGSLHSLKKDVNSAERAVSLVGTEMAELLGEEYDAEAYDEDTVLERLQADPTMSGLEQQFLVTLDRQAEIGIRAATISDMRQRLTQGHQLTDIYKVYENKVQEPLEKERTKTARQKYQNNAAYASYRDIVWENLTGGQAVPNIKRFLPREEGDEASDDEDVEFGAAAFNFHCPITLGVLEDPYKSTKCPHAFSGDAIKEIIQRENGQTPCPVAGCSARLTLSSVEPDENLARRVAAHVKRLREGRTQTSTQAKTYARMELSEDEEGDGEEDEDEETVAARKVKKEVKKEKVARGR